ncbi:Universal stress protein family protein [Sulfitobacter marinus]|uniref:Universal stress protein family protein n=1 Tax=Sulfitobacter marinus TaxID=394264 RepID=A0A1I6VBW7_9RHOB|nr:universal stress protein [Sulfitobacter marinus]SFT11132.1 Universal stress protein family protein [Sulfitobacter marinus]
MKNSTILLVIGTDTSLATLAQKLEVIRAIPAHAAIVIVGEMPVFSYYAVSVEPFGTPDISPQWQQEVNATKAALRAKETEVENLLQQHEVSGDVSTVAAEPAAIADHIARRAMLCDMAWIDEGLRTTQTLFKQALYGILLQSPVGVLLNDPKGIVLPHPKRVFIAWNTQLQAARAVQQALPLLRQADEVIIGTFDPVMTEFGEGEDPGIDLAKWLTHHGCSVTVQQYPSGGQPVGDCILDHAKESGADMIVMGSYGHSRTREAIFGGTTRTLVEQTDLPVFLAH